MAWPPRLRSLGRTRSYRSRCSIECSPSISGRKAKIFGRNCSIMQKRLVALLFSFGLGTLLEGFALFELFTSRYFPAAATPVVLLSHFAACLVLVPGFLLLLPAPYRTNKWL